MDNERPIEKLLRRFAKKRREDAGAPMEIHPATRRMLQGEVSRQFGKDRSGRASSAKATFRWWPRLAFGLCALAVVGLLVAVLLPAPDKSRVFEMNRADINPQDKLSVRSIGSQSADQPSPSPEVARDENLAAAAPSESKFAKAEGFDDYSSNPATLALAEAPGPGSVGPASSRAGKDTSLTTVSLGVVAGTPASIPPSALSQETTNSWIASRSGVDSGQSLSAASRKLEAGNRQGGGTGGAAVDSIQQLQQSASFSNLDKNNSKTPVLASFDVEQTGNELRVIDSDGSTYSGNFVSAEVLQDTKTDLDAARLKKKSAVMEKAASAISESEPQQNLSFQNAFFRVSGTNNTLKQQVVFTGNFIPVSNASQSQLSNLAIANQLQSFSNVQAFPSLLNNSVIVGRAQLEGDNAVDVNAVPVLKQN